MATTLPNMSLVKWSLSTDEFSHTELASNWDKVDQHDHTSGKGLQVPTGGLVDGSVTLAKLASGAVDASKIVNTSITDAKLASPGAAAYKTIAMGGGVVPGGAGTYGANHSGSFTGSGDSANALRLVPLVATDYAVSGKTTKLFVRAVLATNATASTGSYTVGIYPITAMAGAGGNLSATFGSVISGSTIAFATPAASSILPGSSGDFTFPSDGQYALGVNVTGSPAASSRLALTIRLDWHHV